MLNSKLEDSDIIYIDKSKFNKTLKEEYLKEFEVLKENGIIKNTNNFEDDKWIFIYGGKEYPVTFLTDIEYKKLGELLKLSLADTKLAYKSFYIKQTPTKRVDNFKSILYKLIYLKEENTAEVHASKLNIIILFLNYIKVPKSTYNTLINQLEIQEDAYSSRTLPTFKSVFEFEDIMSSIKKYNKLEKYKEYIPTILWWHITSILPIRPTEFLITKFDCIYSKDDQYYLVVHRSTLKKRKKIKNIALEEECYQTDTVTINKDLYDFICSIKNLIIKITGTDTHKYLLPIQLLNFKRKKQSNINLITDIDLNKNIKKFYTNVIATEFGKTPISRFEQSDDINDIERLTPYDTRHLAIINLVLLGTEVQTVMELAGHDNINTTLGYYNHIQEYTTCKAISFAKKMQIKDFESELPLNNPNTISSHSKVLLNLMTGGNKKFKVDGGYCCYHKVKEDMNYCFLHEGKHSYCEYFIPNEEFDLMNSITGLKKDIDTNVKMLIDLVKSKATVPNYFEKYSIITSKLNEQTQNLSNMFEKVGK